MRGSIGFIMGAMRDVGPETGSTRGPRTAEPADMAVEDLATAAPAPPPLAVAAGARATADTNATHPNS